MSSTASGASTVTPSVRSRSDSLDSFQAQSHIDYLEHAETDGITRQALRGMEAELVDLVLGNACTSVWMEWLRLPLQCATSSGSLDSVKRLLGAGVSWKAASSYGTRSGPLLHTAAASGNEGVVEELIRAGADVHAVDGRRSNRTALHVAAAEGTENSARALISAGAAVDARDSRGWTPLHVACLCGHRGVVVFLLLKGADALTKTLREGDTPLHLAASGGHEGVISDLLEFGHACVSCGNNARETALHVAARMGHLQACITLLRAGASSGRLSAAGVSPLDVAALSGHSIRLLAVLTAAEARHDRQRRCSLALYYAVKGNKPETVRNLVLLGANVDHRRFNGVTCLHYSAQRGHYLAAEALLQAGADVDARNDDEGTPLHDACMFSKPSMVQLLLQWDADEGATTSANAYPAEIIGIGEVTASSSGEEGEDPLSEAIKDLLARAPADRVWRRRGWLLMCRARWFTRIKETPSPPSPVRTRARTRLREGRAKSVGGEKSPANTGSSKNNTRGEEKHDAQPGSGVVPASKSTRSASLRKTAEASKGGKGKDGAKGAGAQGKSAKVKDMDIGERASRSQVRDRSTKKKVLRATLRLGKYSLLKDGVRGLGEGDREGAEDVECEDASFVGAVERMLLLREVGVFREIVTYL